MKVHTSPVPSNSPILSGRHLLSDFAGGAVVGWADRVAGWLNADWFGCGVCYGEGPCELDSKGLDLSSNVVNLACIWSLLVFRALTEAVREVIEAIIWFMVGLAASDCSGGSSCASLLGGIAVGFIGLANGTRWLRVYVRSDLGFLSYLVLSQDLAMTYGQWGVWNDDLLL